MTRSLVEREVISDHLVKEITIEYLMARGEQPYRILRGGYSLWETHVPAMRLALVAAIQSVEGGVQVAAKQESCPESAPRTETAILNRLFALTAALRLHDDYMSEQFSGPESDALHPKAVAKWRNIRKVLADAALTKTPSADHDDCNLRSLSAPNHQPHAVSQGWRDIETAPRDGSDFLASTAYGVRLVFWDTARGGVWSVWPGRDKALHPTHWMPLPSPPSKEGE